MFIKSCHVCKYFFKNVIYLENKSAHIIENKCMKFTNIFNKLIDIKEARKNINLCGIEAKEYKSIYENNKDFDPKNKITKDD